MNTLPYLIHFLYRDYFSPVIDTWFKAIDAVLFTTWSGLAYSLVRKNLPKSIYMEKCHLVLAPQHV